LPDISFTGYGLNAIDTKNRLSIPSEFRDVIKLRAGASDLYIGPAKGFDCLIAYDDTHHRNLQARLDAQAVDEESVDGAMRAIGLFGSTLSYKIDEPGRIVVTAGLRDLGDFTSHVWFIAGGKWFQMWNPYRFLELPDLDPRMRRTLVRDMQAKGLPLEEPAR
jgi:MraZ protein